MDVKQTGWHKRVRAVGDRRRSSLVLAAVSLGAIAAACSESPTPHSPAPTQESTVTEVSVEFDVASFAAINPNPEIRPVDPEVDLGFYENDRLDRDAIEPIYTPKFVAPDEATLQPDEIVMGLAINGDTRAYPTGLLRVRELVNDDVGGTPVLVSW